jgi:hypothetical protein
VLSADVDHRSQLVFRKGKSGAGLSVLSSGLSVSRSGILKLETRNAELETRNSNAFI